VVLISREEGISWKEKLQSGHVSLLELLTRASAAAFKLDV
jgi:hypothetical protein